MFVLFVSWTQLSALWSNVCGRTLVIIVKWYHSSPLIKCVELTGQCFQKVNVECLVICGINNPGCWATKCPVHSSNLHAIIYFWRRSLMWPYRVRSHKDLFSHGNIHALCWLPLIFLLAFDGLTEKAINFTSSVGYSSDFFIPNLLFFFSGWKNKRLGMFSYVC